MQEIVTDDVMENRILKRELSVHIGKLYGSKINNIVVDNINWLKNKAYINTTRNGLVCKAIEVDISNVKAHIAYFKSIYPQLRRGEENIDPSTQNAQFQQQHKNLVATQNNIKNIILGGIDDIFPITEKNVLFEKSSIIVTVKNHHIHTYYKDGDIQTSNHTKTQAHLRNGHAPMVEKTFFSGVVGLTINKDYEDLTALYFSYFTQLENLMKLYIPSVSEDVDYVKQDIKEWLHGDRETPFEYILGRNSDWHRTFYITYVNTQTVAVRVVVESDVISHDVYYENIVCSKNKIASNIEPIHNVIKSYLHI